MPAGSSRAPADAVRVVDALTPVVTEVVERAGLVLDDLEVRPAGRRQVVRVLVDADRVPGPDDDPAPGADLDAVAGVSRELSAALDELESTEKAPSQNTILNGEYTLEVSTPGTDRPLTEIRHWRRAWLRRVVITGVDGAETAGRVGPVADGGADADAGGPRVTLAVTDRRGVTTLRTVELADVARAVVEVEFKPAPAGEVAALRAAAAEPGTTDHESEDPS